ncbi:MAG TPA: hypothetical protein VER57_07655 [Cyanobium sp.]|jgi:hypothetical protein|nr:hypothetical protein [Cyanobium sp.]
MPLPLLLPLLLAASPVAMEAPAPTPFLIEAGPVETFDPIGRARLIAELLPRNWRGTYRAFDGSPPVPVQLQLDSTTPMGQMVDLRGQLRLGDSATAVQGNINAKSDQLDLLLLTDEPLAGLDPGGEFQGLQTLSLSGWRSSRLTSLGGRLQLNPAPAAPGEREGSPLIRGLW